MSKKGFNLKKIKKEYIIVAVLILVAVYFIFSSFKGITSNKTTTNQEKTDIQTYVEQLEEKIEDTLSSVKGVGKVTVSISVKGSFETVYATEKKTTKTESGEVIVETPIIVGGKTVILKENFPEITGLIVVAGNADNLTIKTNILNTIVNFLDIDSKKVIILNGKK